MDNRRREEARGMCEAQAVLNAASARAEELQRGGFDGEVELPGFERTAALF